MFFWARIAATAASAGFGLMLCAQSPSTATKSAAATPPAGPPCYGRSYGKGDLVRLRNDSGLADRVTRCGTTFLLDADSERSLRTAGVPAAVLAKIARAPETVTPPPADPVKPGPTFPFPSTRTTPTVPLRVTGMVQTNPRDGLRYVWINPGTYYMGCSVGDQDCDPDERPVTKVQLTAGFWIGKTEVPQIAYEKIMAGKNPSKRLGFQFPVESVTWIDATLYCDASGMRLPWEREWEYAARAGTISKFGSASLVAGDPSAVAWGSENSGNQTHPVGSKQANAWGLQDMLGNVAEWMIDSYPNYPGGSVMGATGPSTGTTRTLRGGSFVLPLKYSRVSNRDSFQVHQVNNAVGFRCAGPTIP